MTVTTENYAVVTYSLSEMLGAPIVRSARIHGTGSAGNYTSLWMLNPLETVMMEALHANVAGARQGYLAGTNHKTTCPQPWLQVPLAPQGLAGLSRSCVSGAPQGDLRAWALLAPARGSGVQVIPAAEDPAGLLASEVAGKSAKG